MAKKHRQKTLEASPAPASAPPPPSSSFLIPAFVAAASAAVYLPALRNEFHWDDFKNLVDNPGYKGLDAAHLGWMLKGSFGFMGNYEPLHWLTMGLVHAVSGMNPVGYHLFAYALHAACAVLLYSILKVLLKAAWAPEPVPEPRLSLCAAAGALFFALHPQRVEAVAWASGQHYALAAVFYLGAVRGYLARKPLLSLAAFFLSLFSLPIGMTLPAALLILDWYPLRRLSRAAFIDKLPYFALTALGALSGILARRAAGTVMPLGYHSFAYRVAQSFWGWAFYVRKLLLPLDLLPYYQFPPKLEPLAPMYTVSAAAVLLVSLGCWLLRRSRPALLAAWGYYVLTVLPVIGLTQTGLQMAADRYTYFACWSFAALFSAGLLALPAAALGGGALVLALLSALTVRYEKVWRNSESIWRYSISVDPDNSTSHNNLGNALFKRGLKEEAGEHYRRAIELKPKDANALFNYGVYLGDAKQYDKAIIQYRAAAASDPKLDDAWANIGDIEGVRGNWQEAAQAYSKALELRPGRPDVEVGLGRALDRLGRGAEAQAMLEKAAARAPQDFDARINLGLAKARRGDFPGAVAEFQAAAALRPKEAVARQNLGAALARSERLDEAIEQYEAAIALSPGYAEAYANLGMALARQKKWGPAEERFRQALSLSPGNEGYKRNLAEILRLKGG